jgi:hypothetical protein
MTIQPAPPPVVCTLTTKALAERSLEWSDIRPMALSNEALPTGARSTYRLADADAIEDLATREISCCGSWLTIKTTRSDVLTMTVTTDSLEGVDLIRTMTGLSR